MRLARRRRARHTRAMQRFLYLAPAGALALAVAGFIYYHTMGLW